MTRPTTFAELTAPSAQCRLCALAQANPNVLFVVHSLYAKGVRGLELSRRLERVLGEAQLPQFAPLLLSQHLTVHCTFQEPHIRIPATAPSEASAPAPAPTPAPAPVPAAVAAPVRRPAPTEQRVRRATDVDDYATDYGELRTLFLEIKRLFSDACGELESPEMASLDDDPLNLEKGRSRQLVTVLRIGRELRQILKTLADMRNSEKLFNVVLVKHTEQLVQGLADPVSTILKDARDRLARGEAPADIAARLDALIKGGIFPMFDSAARQALAQSRENYKLH